MIRYKAKKHIKLLLYIAAVLCIGVALISGIQITLKLQEYHKSKTVYEKASQEYLQSPSAKPQVSLDTESDLSQSAVNSYSPADLPQVNFDKLSTLNPDFSAWLFCPDTNINYPVVQGEDNTFYLKHLYDKEKNPSGTLFIDAHNGTDFRDRNTVIYGHNMKDGTMFSTLSQYKSQDYYDTHKVMYLLTPRGNYALTLFAGYVTAVDDDAWQIDFANDSEYMGWISKAASRSTFQASDVRISESDRVITLSTCDYKFENARYVVVGKLEYLGISTVETD